MKQASNLRSKIKFLIYRFFSPRIVDNIRNLLSLRHRFFYRNKDSKNISELISNSKVPINRDLNLLKELHKYFKKIDLKENYKFENLLLSAKNRYNFLEKNGLNLKGANLADFGAGHGENLFLCKEYNLSRAVGLDFSDKDFLPHKNDLRNDVFQFIEFKTLDLVNEDLGIKDFDVITSFSAFEHFHDPKEVLLKCYKSLKPGGYLYAEFAAFNSPYAIHRKKFSGVPHIQNIFDEDIAFEFFYDFLKINDKVNRYTNEPITNGDPYPEVNRYLIPDYEKIFLDQNLWEVISYTKIQNYQYHWFIKLFEDSFKNKDNEYKYVDYLKFSIRNR